MTVTNQNVLDAAEYSYNNYLSKSYTNESVKFDWDYKAKDGTVINRPNHGLAHSFRGESYAPVVCKYFKVFAKDKKDFQFSPDDVKKIQIALMFRVAGRENDGGFSDNADDYKRYQKNHGEAFKQYCKDNPEIFTDEEVAKYADALQTYAVPGQNDPLKVIFKACHNMDLIRCCDNARMERELQPIRDQIGDYTNDLVVYADACIRQTGTRIQDKSPITKKDKVGYEEEKFVAVSQSVNLCAQEISNVPTPAELYYQKANAFRINPAKQAEYVKHLEMASKLGHEKATRRLNSSLYRRFMGGASNMDQLPGIDLNSVLGHPLNLGAPPAKLSDIKKISNEWARADEAELYGIEVIRKIDFCKGILDDNLNLPQPLSIKFDGKSYTGDKPLLMLSKELSKIAIDMNDLVGMCGSNYEKSLMTDKIDDLAFVARAVSELTPSNNKKINSELNTINAVLARNKINPKTQADVDAEKVKMLFLEGKGQEVEKQAEKSSGNVEKKIQLEHGPLNKNVHTYRYESLMRDMLSGKDFTTKKENEQLIVKFGDDKEYNVAEILKYANLNHLQISEADSKAYMDFIASDKVKYSPCKPNEANPKVPTELKSTDEIAQLDQSFLKKDPSLGGLSQAERIAINVYSTGFYRNANAMLRGGRIAELEIKELVCTTGMAVAGLNKIDEDVPVNTFRGEKRLPEEVLNARIDAAEKGGTTMEVGFISTSMGQLDRSFAFQDTMKENIGIVFKDLRGKNINVLSAFPGEREFLIPPTQIEWQHHVSVQGGHIFTAKPATTLTGLEPNALTGLTLEEKEKFEPKINKPTISKLDLSKVQSQDDSSSKTERKGVDQSVREVHEIGPGVGEAAKMKQKGQNKAQNLTLMFQAKIKEAAKKRASEVPQKASPKVEDSNKDKRKPR